MSSATLISLFEGLGYVVEDHAGGGERDDHRGHHGRARAGRGRALAAGLRFRGEGGGASTGTIRRIADGANSGRGTSPRLGAAGAAVPSVRSPSPPLPCRGRDAPSWPGPATGRSPRPQGPARGWLGPAHARSTSSAPIRTSSPSLRRRRWSIRSPFTKVPFVDPRSSIDSWSSAISTCAWRREASGSLTVMSQPSRPIVEADSTPRSMPCIGSCSMRLNSLIASAPRGRRTGGSGSSGLAWTPDASRITARTAAASARTRGSAAARAARHRPLDAPELARRLEVRQRGDRQHDDLRDEASDQQAQ